MSRVRTIALEKEVEKLKAEVERINSVCRFLSSSLLNINELIALQEEDKDD